jgi:2-iminoacetate synthase
MTALATKTNPTPEIIDHLYTQKLLRRTTPPDSHKVIEIINKAKELHGLSLEDVALLLSVSEPALLQEIYTAAKVVKETIYGKRLVLFAPLYISNYCCNTCKYCAFNANTTNIQRRALSQAEISDEVEALMASGHKRLLLVAGESRTKSPIDYICNAIDTIYKTGDTDTIRRINVNIAPLEKSEFEVLKSHHIGTYQLFQETYHLPTYRQMHPRGPKADYTYRLTVMDRAIAAGIDDVGIGVLFGLFDYRYEVLALMQHIRHLEKHFGIGPHTISVPRLEPAAGAEAALNPPFPVTDEAFQKIVAILRLAVPYTGIILSTRESPAMRAKALALGVSQISAGSRTNPGGYSSVSSPLMAEPQFQLGDHRSLDEVIHDVLSLGYLPSFCTGCYRKGRTGKDFMDLAKPGLIKRYCLPNALLTLKEYLEDYASPKTQRRGLEVLQQQLDEISSKRRKEETKQLLKEIEKGKRDIFF